MREYEIVYLIADSIAEDKQASVVKKVAKYITDLGGKVLKEENLGRRRLAYTVAKNDFATYILLNIQLDGSKIKELERDLTIAPEIIRHLLILRKMEKVSVLEEKVAAVANEELKEVIGERSFEQVEGETEESRGLMAKREVSIEEHEEAEKETPKDEEVREIVEEEIAVSQEEKIKEEKKVLKPRVKKTKKVEVPPAGEDDKAERLRKLDEKLDKILKDDL